RPQASRPAPAPARASGAAPAPADVVPTSADKPFPTRRSSDLLHHVNPRAKGGPPSAANLTLRCHAHHALAAEQDFGRDFVRAKRDARDRGKMRSSVVSK